MEVTSPVAEGANETFTFFTFELWPRRNEDVHEEEPANLIVLPLGALLALVFGVCMKISHWWNEDIREADGMLQNAYSPSYPHRKVLVRVVSTESDPDSQKRYPPRTHANHIKTLLRQSSISDVPDIESDLSSMSRKTVGRTRGSLTSQPRSSITILNEENETFNQSIKGRRRVPGLALPRRNDSCPCMTGRPDPIARSLHRQISSTSSATTSLSTPVNDRRASFKTPPAIQSVYTKRNSPRKRIHSNRAVAARKPRRTKLTKSNLRMGQTKKNNGGRQKGVSRLVMDSFNFNLNLMHLAMNSDLEEAASRTSSLGSRSSQESLAESLVSRQLKQYQKPDESGFIEDSFIDPGGCHLSKRFDSKRDSTFSFSPQSPISPSESSFVASSASCSVALTWDNGSPQSPSSSPVSVKPSFTAKYQRCFSSSASSAATSLTSLSRSSASHLNDSRMFYRITSASSMEKLAGNFYESHANRNSDIPDIHYSCNRPNLKRSERYPGTPFVSTSFAFPPASIRKDANEKPLFFLV